MAYSRGRAAGSAALSVALALALVPAAPQAAAADDAQQPAAAATATEAMPDSTMGQGAEEGAEIAGGQMAPDGADTAATAPQEQGWQGTEEAVSTPGVDAGAVAPEEALAPQDADAVQSGDAASDGAGEGLSSAASEDGNSADSSAASSSDNNSGNSSGSSSSSASDTQQAGAEKLDPAKLADGTYTVSVKLLNADNVANVSMAAKAVDGTDELSVKDGKYTLGVKFTPLYMGEAIGYGYVSQLDKFDTFSVADSKLQVSGAATPVWTAKKTAEQGGDPGPAALPVPDSAKKDGYIGIQLHSEEMPVSPQKAVLSIDWSTLAKKSEETQKFDDDATGAKTAEPAQQQQTTNPTADPATTTDNTQATTQAKFQVGHVYTVPITITKSGSTETSMAAQYFGGSANVRPLANGMFDVRFTTNRPDYIESVSYQGTAATVTYESSSTREYSIRIPRTESDTTIPLSFVVTPMKQMGGGPVTADMHLYLSRATDTGGDSGQVATSNPSSTGSTVPKTGDSLAPAYAAIAGATALISLIALLAAGLRLRRLKE